jgi:hypothetical protein
VTALTARPAERIAYFLQLPLRRAEDYTLNNPFQLGRLEWVERRRLFIIKLIGLFLLIFACGKQLVYNQ